MKLGKLLLPVLTGALLLVSSLCRAQVAPGMDSLLVRALATDELLPLLIDSALKNSPQIRVAGNTADIARANLRMNKKSIYNALSVSTVYGYGNTVTAGSNQPTGGTTINNLVTQERANYNVGVGLYLPLTQLLNRKDMIQAGKLQIRIAEHERENDSIAIRQEVIRLYQAMKLAQRLVTVSGKRRQGAQINNSMAEKNFLQGQITIDQYSEISERHAQALQDFETAANNFQTSFLLLEAFTGVHLSKLISQVK
ncbi:TolC family protein [Paraflavisolibacter sp. H34]|uniref:TolC family protein n=1 Tax=Huijunlia imazamoxiresistens TaxID=3127457 RepID=UPI0030192F9B